MVEQLEDASIVLWDLDGTWFDGFELTHAILCEVLPKHGFAAPTHEQFQLHHHGTMRESVIDLLGGPVSPAIVDAMMTDFHDRDHAMTEQVDAYIFPDALRLMRTIHERGIYQVTVTNRTHGNGRYNSPRTMIERSAVADYMDDVICGDEVGFRKPDDRVLQRLRDEGMVDLSRPIVVGDQFIDALFALGLGASAILVARHGTIAHLDRLPDGWESYVTIVDSLDNVST